MKHRAILICVLVMMLFSWAAVRQVWASGKCQGEKYVDHPALQEECLHQQTVNTEQGFRAYPEPESEPPPDDASPYPEPAPIPRPDPTEPPEY